METIKNYLETMFLKLPNTPEVQRAKNELWQMMEDKYTELKAEGKSENEAVGIVISEFGNLDELANDLGISQVVKEEPETMKILPLDEVKKYLAAKSKQAVFIGVGVMLCIMSVIGPIMMDAFNTAALFEVIGVAILFTLIAIAVGLFIAGGMVVSPWNKKMEQGFSIDFATTQFVEQQRETFRSAYTVQMIIGVMLCILWIVPLMVLDELVGGYMADSSASVLFLFVGIGVCLIVSSSIRFGSYTSLLQMNKADSMGGSYATEQPGNPNESEKGIMAVYWQTITCVYLCWSFLTYDWHITWIIWPIAGVVHSLIKNVSK